MVYYNHKERKGDKKMNYNDNELRIWFEKMIKKYPNSNTRQHLESVYYMMFEDSLNNLKKVLDK